MIRQRTRLRITPEEFCPTDSQQIDAPIEWWRQIVPFAQLFRVFSAEVLLPALDKKLWVRRSNEEGLRIGAREQFARPSRRSTQHGVDDRSLLLRPERHSFMDRCVFSCFEEEKL